MIQNRKALLYRVAVSFIISYNLTHQTFFPSLFLRKYRLGVFPKVTLGNMPDWSHI